VATYRIVTEAVTNVARHARASNCRLTLCVNGGTLRAVVWDDGRGMSAEDPVGNGMQTMRERAEELRGRLTVTSDGGTSLVAELPLGVVPPRAPAEPLAKIPVQP
jgi:signal transduction histidine kinase